jgi:hypothetical protein
MLFLPPKLGILFKNQGNLSEFEQIDPLQVEFHAGFNTSAMFN